MPIVSILSERVDLRAAGEAHGASRQRSERLMLQLFDVLVACVLFIGPLFMGGRHPVGRIVYAALITGMAWTWCGYLGVSRRPSYRHCGLEMCVIAALGLVLLQCVGLPTSFVERLAPRQAHFLSLWQSSDEVLGFGPWRHLSLTPHASRLGFAMLLAHAVFLILLVQRIQDRADMRRLIDWVALSGVWLAAWGLLQFLFGNGKFLWIYQDPFRSARDVVRGPFYNENHFAHCLALAILPLWSSLRACRERQRQAAREFRATANSANDLAALLLTIALPALVFTLLISRSRGGMIAALLAVLIGSWGFWGRTLFQRQQLWRLGVAVVAIAFALSMHGLDQVRAEMGTLTTTSLDDLDQRGGRRYLWQAAREIVGQFTLVGAGVGSFRDTFPIFYEEPRFHDYAYAESGYLQVAAETGVTGVGLLLLALWIIAIRLIAMRKAMRSAADRDLCVPVIGGLVLSLVHATIDFVWFIPACSTFTLALLAISLRWAIPRTEPAASDRAWTGRHVLTTSLAGSAVLTVCVAQLLGPAGASRHWNAYLLAAQQDRAEQAAGDGDPNVLDLGKLVAHRQRLRSVVTWDPWHVPARLHLASICMQIFELEQAASDNPMSLAQIRDAALASQFPTRRAQDQWLDVVLQRRRGYLDEAFVHARDALQGSPLQGRGYIYLAELAFLHTPGSDGHATLIRQALRVRPHDSRVLFAAGREAALSGDIGAALKLWRHAYHQDQAVRRSIMHQIAPLLPAHVFLENFQPQLQDLIELWELYRGMQRHDQACAMAQAYLDRLTRTASSTPEDAFAWQQGYRLAAELHDPRAIAIARRALKLDPLNDGMRRRLAMELLARGELDEAIVLLQDYMRTNPADALTAGKLASARQQLRDG
jgi:tetratricopeptide (TPR) repeat protein